MSFADAVARSAPAVVSIYAARTAQVPPVQGDPRAQQRRWPAAGVRGGAEIGLGSGVILSGDGLILTNRHVVEGADNIRAVLADGRSLQVAVLGLDPETDLAALKADAVGLPTAPVGDPGALRVGDVALAIGNPYGVGQTVTQGIVSATGRAELGLTPIESYIQTDAAINPGNSGGALVNARGELVGVNTASYSESGTSDGIGFAIPSDLALKVARAIVAKGRVERGWIGMRGRSVTPGVEERFGLRAPGGVLVSSTLPKSPAEQAGLRPGDVISGVGGQEIRSLQELQDAIAGAGVHRSISLEVWRGSERIEVGAVTQPRPSSGD
jgi:S1-C subfamily serine protease